MVIITRFPLPFTAGGRHCGPVVDGICHLVRGQFCAWSRAPVLIVVCLMLPDAPTDADCLPHTLIQDIRAGKAVET